jgi:hypothetical protein
VWGKGFDAASNSIHLQGNVSPGKTISVILVVKVNHHAASGTVITNMAHLTDDALGGSASVTTTVVKWPHSPSK